MEQLKNGLKDTLQFELMLTLYATETWSLFAGTNAYDVSVDFLLDPFVIQFSDQGSKNRVLEENIVYMWSQYVTECAYWYIVITDCMYNVYVSLLQEVARPRYLTFFSFSLELTSYQLLG